jgi:hypothetical protein
MFSNKLFPIILIGFVVRLIFILIQPLSLDELLTYEVLRVENISNLFNHILKNDLQLPSFYLFLYSIKNLFIENHSIYRLSLGLLSLCGIYFSYRTAKSIINKQAANLAALIYSLSFSLVLFGVEFRPYSILLVFSSLMNMIYFEKKEGYLLKLVIVGLLASTFHYYGILLIVPFLLLEYDRFTRFFKNNPFKTFFSFGFFFLALIPVIPTIIRNYNIGHTYREKTLSYLGLDHILNFLSLFFWGPVGFIIFLVILFFFLSKNNITKINRKVFELIFIGLLPMFLVFIKSFTSTPTLEPRYFIAYFPPFVVCSAVILFTLESKIKKIIQPLFIVVIFFDLFVYRNILVSFREDIKAKYKFSASVAKEMSLPIISCGGCFWPYVSSGDDYTCLNGKNAGNEMRGVKRAIVVQFRAGDASCRDLYPEMTKLKSIKNYNTFLYTASQ